MKHNNSSFSVGIFRKVVNFNPVYYYTVIRVWMIKNGSQTEFIILKSAHLKQCYFSDLSINLRNTSICLHCAWDFKG